MLTGVCPLTPVFQIWGLDIPCEEAYMSSLLSVDQEG